MCLLAMSAITFFKNASVVCAVACTNDFARTFLCFVLVTLGNIESAGNFSTAVKRNCMEKTPPFNKHYLTLCQLLLDHDQF